MLLEAFQAALAAANPGNLIAAHLPSPPQGRTLVVGGGKAAASMAKAVETCWPVESPLSGLVVTRFQHGLPLHRIELLEASHPLPDGRGAAAASRMLDAIQGLTSDDLLLVLLSGGGSSLLALPVEGVTLSELRTITKALLSSGANIQEINTVRKHLTQFSGGRVAALSKAPVHALILSDVVGDEPAYIASGPCAPDPDTYVDALDILERYRIEQPPAVQQHLQSGVSGNIPDTPKTGDPAFHKVTNLVIGGAKLTLYAAQKWLEQRSFSVLNLGEIEGNSREVARAHAELVRKHLTTSQSPFALLSGGETTVNVQNPAGQGGRNSEYLLALGLALSEYSNVWAIACDTDGVDGTQDNAGAIWVPDTLHRAKDSGLDPEALLEANEAYRFFEALGDLVITGPTRTNVNDFRLVLVS